MTVPSGRAGARGAPLAGRSGAKSAARPSSLRSVARPLRWRAVRCVARCLPLLLSLTGSEASGPRDACRPGERVVFSCAVAKAKVVSVCRSVGARPADGSLVYRFGPPGQPELVFPASARDSLQQFRYAHYFRVQTDRTELSFATTAASYTVYDYFEGDEKPPMSRGVRVGVDGRDLDLRCVGPVVSRLAELADVVPCDEDNALATCR